MKLQAQLPIRSGPFKKQQITQGKKIKARPSDSSSSLHQSPLFCLKHLDQRGFGLSDLEINEKAAFVERLHHLSGQTWNQLFSGRKKASGCEKINFDQITGPKPNHITEDTKIIVFRFIRKGRIVGYQSERVFNIIWVDCKMKLYKH